MKYQLLICTGCRRRAARCICASEGGSAWSGLRTRSVEVEAVLPEDAAVRRESLIAYLRDRGQERAVQELLVRVEGERIIDRVLSGKPARPEHDGRARLRTPEGGKVVA